MPNETEGTEFTVIQVSPGNVEDERVNVGVIAADGSHAAVRLLNSWHRATRFCGGDLAGVRGVLERLRERIDEPDREPFTSLDLASLVGRDTGVIRFSALRASAASVEEAVRQAAKLYLVDPENPDGSLRGRDDAKAIVKARVRAALRQHLTDESVETWLRPNLRGEAASHSFDAVIANGKPLGVLHGMSFQEGRPTALFEYSEALAFRVFDVRFYHSDLRAGVLAFAPVEHSTPQYSKMLSTYDRAKKIFGSVNADILDEQSLDEWLKPMVEQVAKHPSTEQDA